MRREIDVNRKQDETRYIIFQQEKQGEKLEKQGKKHKKKHEKQGGKNRKLQELHKQDFDEVLGNAENKNEFSTRFREMLKTEKRTKTRSSRMSQNDDSRAKTRYRCRPKVCGSWALVAKVFLSLAVSIKTPPSSRP